MRIAIADPGLNNPWGHHFDHTLLLTRALTAQGARVDVHGFARAPDLAANAFTACGAGYQRSFPLWLYATGARHPPPRDWRALARAGLVAAGLRDKPAPHPFDWRVHCEATLPALDALQGYDCVVWPTSTPAQAAALATRPPATRTILGLDGHVQRSWPNGEAVLGKAAQDLARSGAPVSFGTYDFRLAQICAPLVQPFPLLRLPSCADGPPILRRRPALNSAGFFGHQRSERGDSALPGIALSLLNHGFRVTIQDGRGAAGAGLSHANLTVLGFVDDFAAAVDACDAVIWHGDVAQYQTRPSGVIWQAIACGVPIVMPSFCLPAQIAHARGAASFFHRATAEDITNAALRLRDRYEDFAALAHRRAQAWREREGSAALAAAILRPALDGFAAGDLAAL